MLEVYQNIKKRRIELGMSQDELAHLCGYSEKSMIAKIEKGDRDIQINKLPIFAKALNTTPMALLGKSGILQIEYIYEKLDDDKKQQLLNFAIYLEKEN